MFTTLGETFLMMGPKVKLGRASHGNDVSSVLTLGTAAALVNGVNNACATIRLRHRAASDLRAVTDAVVQMVFIVFIKCSMGLRFCGFTKLVWPPGPRRTPGC